MKQLIVNADDFGMSASINEGILECHENGIVTATTWVANGEASDAAAKAAPEGLEVGLHLALHDVSPLVDTARFDGLLNSTQRFPGSHRRVISWIVRSGGALGAIREEWLAQFERFQSCFGKAPTHFDSHRHIGLFPPLQSLLVELAQHAGGVPVRTPADPSFLPSSLIFSKLGKRMRKKAMAAGLPIVEGFLGFRHSGRLTQSRLNAVLRRVGAGTTELMVHPGSQNEDENHRKDERDALTSDETKETIEELGIQLVRPSDLESDR